MSPGRRPASTSSRRRAASRRASTRRPGWVASAASPASKPSQSPRLADEQLDRRLVAAGRRDRTGAARRVRHPGGSARPATSGWKRSPKSGANVALTTSSSSSRDAEVGREAAYAALPQLGPALAEDRHVGVAEARRSTGTRRRPRTGCRARALAARRAGARFVSWNSSTIISSKRSAQRRRSASSLGQQVAHAELEVLEVDARARRLGLRVGARRTRRAARRAARAPGGAWWSAQAARNAVHASRYARTPAASSAARAVAELRRRERRPGAGRRRPPAGASQRLERARARRRPRRPAHAARAPRPPPRARLERSARCGTGRARRAARHPDQPGCVSPAAAQRRVGGEDASSRSVWPVGGREVDRRRALGGDPVVERALERALGEPPRGRLVEHGEARVEPGGQRRRAQHARAEAVDRADPRAVDRARLLAVARAAMKRARTRSRSSAAAFSVNVSARMRADRHAVARAPPRRSARRSPRSCPSPALAASSARARRARRSRRAARS